MFRYASNRSLILTLGLAVSMVTSCARPKSPPLSFDKGFAEVVQPKVSVATPDVSSIELKEVQVVAAEEAKMAAESSNLFAIDLHRQFSGQEGNLFYSPASISVALGLTYSGALGETQKQMAKVLHVPTDQAAWAKACQQLLPLFNQKADGLEINLANRLWGQKGFTFNPTFLQNAQDVWRAPLGELDFIAQADPSRQTINRWVESQTANRIKNLLPTDSITGDTRLVLTNAIYFKGDWNSSFDKNATKKAPFFVSPNEQVKVPLMFQQKRFRYFENKQLQLLSLPYKSADMSMEVLLPSKDSNLKELEKSLTMEQFNLLNQSAQVSEVEVYFPRIKMETSFSMKQILSEMGMNQAFSDAADFGGMTTEDKLKISDVFHKAFLEVDETGTEAAAATAVVMVPISSVTRINLPPVFRADRPFLIMIRHQPTGLILFMGRVTDPR